MSELRNVHDIGAICPSYLDDFRLDVHQFRVYMHLARRAGSGAAWPGIPSIAVVCRCKEETVRKTLAELAAMKLIRRTSRPGFSDLIELTPSREWLAPLPFGGRSPKTTPPVSRDHPPPVSGEGYPSPLGGDEGVPLKESNEGVPSLPSEAPHLSTRARAQASSFKKPAKEEVEAFGKTINLQDWEGFFDYYESNGWKVGRNPMKDWRAAARRWGREEAKTAGKGLPGAKFEGNQEDRSKWPAWKVTKVEGLEEKYRLLKKRVDIAMAHQKDYDAQSRGAEAAAEMAKIRSTLMIEFGVDPCKE